MPSLSLLDGWGLSNIEADENRGKNLFVAGSAPVDGDSGGKLLARAVAGHRTPDICAIVSKVSYMDDEIIPGYDCRSLAPYSYKNGIEASRVPIYVRIGWMDAGTVNGAIERFLSYSNDQTLVIGPWSHAGWHFYDPLIEKEVPIGALDRAQTEELLAFFDPYLKEKAGRRIREEGALLQGRRRIERNQAVGRLGFGPLRGRFLGLDGKVAYVTEGQLRALHRRVSAESEERTTLEPRHSYERKDGMELEPGKVAELKIGMQATSVLIKKGHRIRIAIAGHDASNFARIPEVGEPVIEVERNMLRASFVELPVKERR